MGFTGPSNVDTLQRLLTNTWATGAAGLFAFCVDAARFATNVLTAHPDFSNYFPPDVAPAEPLAASIATNLD
jgi:hypothetical protein